MAYKVIFCQWRHLVILQEKTNYHQWLWIGVAVSPD